MFYAVKEGRLRLRDCDINYIAFGKGEKSLVMIHGLSTRSVKGAGAMLAIMYRIFAKKYRVYLFDRREKVPEGFTVKDMARDTADAMDALGIGRADVFGVSEGGMIAQYLMVERPDLVHKAVLAVTLARNNETVKAVIENWIALTGADNYKALVRDMAEKMYSEKYLKRYKPFMPLLTLMQKPKDKERFLRLAASCLTCDIYGELERVKCPVLVIGGKEDKVVTGHASEEIAERLCCELYMYEGLGHAAYEEAKDFNKRVYAFLIREEIKNEGVGEELILALQK